MAQRFPARWVMAGHTKTRYIDVGGETPVLRSEERRVGKEC